MNNIFNHPVHKRFFLIIVFLILLAAVPLIVFVAQKPQDIRQRATGQTNFFFSQDATCTNPITNITLPTGTTTLYLCLNTAAYTTIGFDFTVNLSSLLPFATLQTPAEGSGAVRFESLAENTFNATAGTFRLSKLTSTDVTGANLVLASIPLTVNAAGTGSIGLQSGTVSTVDPSITSGELTVDLPTLTYTITTTAPTATGIPGATDTPTPTATGTPATPTPTGIATTTNTPAPTAIIACSAPILPTATATTTQFLITATLPTIGNLGNPSPITCQKQFTAQIFYAAGATNLINTQVGSDIAGSISYDPATQTYKGVIDAASLPRGQYFLKIKIAKYLQKLIPGFQTVSAASTTIAVSLTNPAIGDINTVGESNNVLDVQDYNTIISCFGSKAGGANCPNGNIADLDENGKVDAIDLNIYLRSKANIRGD